MKKAASRLSLIRNQLLHSQIQLEKEKNPFDKYINNSRISAGKQDIEKVYYPYYDQYRQFIYKLIFESKEFKFNLYNVDMHEARKISVMQMKFLFNEFIKNNLVAELQNDVEKASLAFEGICDFDESLNVRIGVHFLYFSALEQLSSTKHNGYMERALKLEDVGCFALTEFGHGSNVKDIKTVAVYDEVNDEFILHSPDLLSYKWWIGGAAKAATMSVVFAQLQIKDKNFGVHAFVVQLRDKSNHEVLDGIIIGDCGPKNGMNAIDNGFIIFNNHRISRENMLDKLSQVNRQGDFTSSISDNETRFVAFIGALGLGRVSLLAMTTVS